MPSDAIAASHSCRSSPGPQNQRMTRGEGRVCGFDRVHDLDPRLVELELGVEHRKVAVAVDPRESRQRALRPGNARADGQVSYVR